VKFSTWVSSGFIGLIAAIAVFADMPFLVLFATIGLLYVAFTVAHPRPALLFWLLLAPVANTYARLSLPVGLPDVTFIRASIGAVIVALLFRSMRERRPFAPFGGAELAMLALISVSLLDLVSRSRNIFSDALQNMDERIIPVLIFVAARNLCAGRDDVKKVAYILVAVGGYLAVHGTYQYFVYSSPDISPVEMMELEAFSPHLAEGRAVGPFGDGIEFGGTAAIAFMSALTLLLYGSGGPARWLLLAMLALLGAAVVESSTRSSWLSLFLAILAFAWLNRQWRMPILASVAAAAIAIVAVTPLLPEDSLLVERASSTEPVYGRLNMYKVAASMAVRRPFLGYGRGEPTFRAARVEVLALGASEAEWAPGQFHNVYVMAQVEWGLVGLLSYLAIQVLFVKAALELRRRLRDQRSFAYHFAGLFLTATVVFVTEGLFVDSPPLLYLNGLYFFLAGVVHAQLDVTRPLPAAVRDLAPPAAVIAGSAGAWPRT
jgi:hypothetical protein